jgi:ATP-dependent RNA helicase RhlE
LLPTQGIDVEGISHVINYELPNDVESYVHRVRRTARAGAAGIALSFCDATEVLIMKAIEKLIHQDLPAMGRACLPFGSGCIVAQAAPCGFRSSGTVA